MSNTGISRRTLLKAGAVGTGVLVIGFAAPTVIRHVGGSTQPGGRLNAWLEVTGTGKVRIAQPQSEMGQGIWTSMAQLIAEELEVNWEDVEIYSPIAAPDFNHPFYGFQTTAESLSIRSFWVPARTVGAQAREVLKQAAGEEWGVSPSTLTAESGHIINPATNKRIPYGALVTRAATYPVPEKVELKDPKDWKIIGQSVPRAEIDGKVSGKTVFGTDVVMEGLLTAVPHFAPSFSASIKSINDTEALAVRGVRHVVPLEDVVYVVADGYWPAKKGADALKVEWELGDAATLSTADVFKSLHTAVENGDGAVVEESGQVASAVQSADTVVDVTFEAPYLAHATMEPQNATAHYTADKLTIWAPTQAQGLMGFVGAAVGLTAEQVETHTTFLGCGLGRRFEIDLPIHAARVSKAVDSPVKVLWSREADTRRDFYRPGAVARMRATFDAVGQVTAMLADLSGSSILARAVPDLATGEIDHTNVDGIAQATTPAGVPVHRQYAFGDASKVSYAMRNTAIPVGFWRSVAHSQNAWFMEGFVNEIARQTNTDAVELRLSLMKADRNRTVLKRLAKNADWGNPADGNFQGIAIHEAFGTVLGYVFEIAVKNKRISITRVTAVADVGYAVNPDNIEAQIVSGAITGLTAAMWGEIHVEDGQVVQDNFTTYRMLKLSETPGFNVEVMQLGDAVGGIGEPGTPPVAPAIVHAVVSATGESITRLPLSAAGYDLA